MVVGVVVGVVFTGGQGGQDDGFFEHLLRGTVVFFQRVQRACAGRKGENKEEEKEEEEEEEKEKEKEKEQEKQESANHPTHPPHPCGRTQPLHEFQP